VASAALVFLEQQPLRPIPQAMREPLGVLSDSGGVLSNSSGLVREPFETLPQIIHAGARDVLRELWSWAGGHTGTFSCVVSACRRHDAESIAGRRRPPMRTLLGWILTILGIICGIYGAFQLLIGTVLAIRGPELAAPVGVMASGAVIFGTGALIAWGGRRLRRPRGRTGWR
jgi:hypothetical protein